MSDKGNDRLDVLRSGQLDPSEKKALADIEKYGVHIVQVRSENDIPGWSYTLGLYQRLRKPEVIVVGLEADVAQHLLNEVARRMRDGKDFHEGCRAKGLLEGVDCELRQIEQRWIRQTMGWATWLHDGDEFPVLQCVYPDLKNRFPWEEEFDTDWRGRQPLLFSTPLVGVIEADFWAQNEETSSLSDWKFDDGPHTGVFTTKSIDAGAEPIMYVSHDLSDGAWQFHGAGESKVEDMVLICFHHIIDRDPSIKQLADLPKGWNAERKTSDGKWHRGQNPPEEEAES
jgi:Domain of unknown function (DUF4262)